MRIDCHSHPWMSAASVRMLDSALSPTVVQTPALAPPRVSGPRLAIDTVWTIPRTQPGHTVHYRAQRTWARTLGDVEELADGRAATSGIDR